MATARALATRSNAHGNPALDRAQFPSVTDDASGTGAVGAPMPFHPVRTCPGPGAAANRGEEPPIRTAVSVVRTPPINRRPCLRPL
jgi:hypothetical protein